ncbi:uncharacterized protein [Watersipora subatra]|uniref:uncharacterized protein n=1 Tax=Watersipora subatra TaxID=2589382 RepID=UPI00355BE0B5
MPGMKDISLPTRARSATTRQPPSIPKKRVQSAKERQLTYSVNHVGDRHLLTSGTSQSRDNKKQLPRSLEFLSEYIATDLPVSMDHPALRGSLVMLPGLCDTYGHNLPTVPPKHNLSEHYPYTHDVPAAYIHKPKKYTHPYYERLKRMSGWTCNHTGTEVRVGCRSGETVHRYTISKQRNKGDIRDEIVELERLIKGLSTDWSTNSVALYQNEINDLQRKVKYTLSLTSPLPGESEVFDPTGLREFCKEYDTALQALVERHRQCMVELDKLEEMQALHDTAKQH